MEPAKPNLSTGSEEMDPLNALTLQAIRDQQHIIERQKELVDTLKKRVEELEHQQHQRPSPERPPHTKTKATGSSSTATYIAEVQLQRRLQAAEQKNEALQCTVAQLQEHVDALTARLEAQEHAAAQLKAACQSQVAAAESKTATAAHFAAAMESQNARLADQVDRLRREAEGRAYEAAQWRSLVTTIVPHLDHDVGCHAREQVMCVEDTVRRYRARQLAPHDGSYNSSSGGSSCLRTPRSATGGKERREGEDSSQDASRLVWSRTAQSQLRNVSTSASSREADTMTTQQPRADTTERLPNMPTRYMSGGGTKKGQSTAAAEPHSAAATRKKLSAMSKHRVLLCADAGRMDDCGPAMQTAFAASAEVRGAAPLSVPPSPVKNGFQLSSRVASSNKADKF